MVQFITGLSLFAFFTRQVNSFIIFYDPGLGNTQYTEIFHLTHMMHDACSIYFLYFILYHIPWDFSVSPNYKSHFLDFVALGVSLGHEL